MLKDLDGPSFFAQEAYISHTVNATVPLEQNADHIASIHRSIDGDYDQNQLQATAEDAKRKILDLMASKFVEQLSKTESGDEEDRMEIARQALADSLSQPNQTSAGDEDMTALKFTTDAITKATILHKDFTWGINFEERKLLTKDAAIIIPIDPPKRREDLRIPENIKQVDTALINAQTKANIALALGLAASHQVVDGKLDAECMEAYVATQAEVTAGIGIARRANLYGFKVEAEGTRYLTEASFDAGSRLKTVHPMNPKPFAAKRVEKPSRQTDLPKELSKEVKKEKKDEDSERDEKKKSFFKKDFHSSCRDSSSRHRRF
ncbi:MAG: hypothetical protein EZS28_001764 [Streblomastix strix]|uniref:Uncharacterized protein n=1 Tax=Streblomastix strix TaxID=222440 RepID=A0A5J4X859_9EUKA|nr:MAG: hypothetical protein EZS28_001764 [Streblomastix strix]